MFLRFLSSVLRVAEAVNETAGRALSWLLPLMTAATLGVIGCGAMRVGCVWLGESVVYMHASLFMLCVAYTLRHNGHVRIDIFYAKMSAAGRARVDLLGAMFLLVPMCVVILVFSFPYVAASWEVLEHSSEGEGLPAVFLLKTCIPVSAALLMLEGFAMMARSLMTLLKTKAENRART